MRGLALAAALAVAAPAAAQEDRFNALMECRAMAIAQLQLADFETARFGLAATEALKEQANFAMILGFWGDPLRSVEAANEDMNLGERLLIENARRVSRYAREWATLGPLDDALIACVPVVWGAAKVSIDRLLQEGRDRGR